MDTSRKDINMGTAIHVDTEVNKTFGIFGSGEFDLPLQNENCKNCLHVEESSRTGENHDLIWLQMVVQYWG